MELISFDKQKEHLLYVSRTFALTIPFLPYELEDWVGNSYLLCRIADTIEDDPKLTADRKKYHLNQFVLYLNNSNLDNELLKWKQEVCYELSHSAKKTELSLMQDLDAVIGRYYSYPNNVRDVIKKTVSIMSNGMSQSERWLKMCDHLELDSYCYFVAGVVGQLLSELFLIYMGNNVRLDRELFLKLSVSFGEALQLTNILKDIVDDDNRGVSWLKLSSDTNERKMQVLREVITIKHHIASGYKYIAMIPKCFKGIRKFCYLALVMSVATIKNIYKNPLFSDVKQIKISRKQVARFLFLAKIFISCNTVLKYTLSCNFEDNTINVPFNLEELYTRVNCW